MAQYAKIANNPVNTTKVEETKYSISDDALLVRVKGYLKDYVMGNGQPYTFKPLGDLDKKYAGAKMPEQKYADYQKEKQQQEDLRILRNKYLHWSARKEGIGMDPNADGKRVIY
jgi:hypothetical protein